MAMEHLCERCDARVEQQGDHTCASCAKLLGRSPRDPFWGDFANHPDSKLLRIFAADMALMFRMFGRDVRSASQDFVADVRSAWQDFIWLRSQP